MKSENAATTLYSFLIELPPSGKFEIVIQAADPYCIRSNTFQALWKCSFKPEKLNSSSYRYSMTNYTERSTNVSELKMYLETL